MSQKIMVMIWMMKTPNIFLLPLTVSDNSTPKLKTSDVTENFPSRAYSGDIYTLHKLSNFKHLKTNKKNKNLLGVY